MNNDAAPIRAAWSGRAGSPYPDPVAVGFEPAFHGGPEQRVGPRDIPPSTSMSARKRSATGLRMPPAAPVFVEQAPCRGSSAWRSAPSRAPLISCPVSFRSGRIPSGSRRPRRRCPFERQAVYPAVGGHLVARGHQPAAGHQPDPTPVPSVSAAYAFGAIRDPPRHSPSAKAAASLT